MAARLATSAEVRELAAELASTATYPPALLDVWGTIAASQIGLVAWGAEASDGHRLLTAHYAVKAAIGASGAGGPLASMSAGEISASYATAPLTDDDLTSTFYGKSYLALRKIVTARAGTMLVGNSRIRQ